MEGEDWEAKYWDLLSMYALEKATNSKKRGAEVLVDQTDENDYSESIAPPETGLPQIMTMCTPSERAILFERAKTKIVNGVWTAKYKKRPSLGMTTKKCKSDSMAGTRKMVIGNANRKKNSGLRPLGVCIPASHIILVGNGFFPRIGRDDASHICHKATCIEIEHLVWESSDDNKRRERLCNKPNIQKCNCGLNPPCNFEAHKK